MFLDFKSFLKEHAPFYELLIPALDVLLDLVEGSLELIDLPLAEIFAIVGAHLEAGLVLSYLFSATAQRHIDSLSLKAYHNI